MRICLVNAGMGSTAGGVETLVEQMALWLGRKHEVTVITGKGVRVPVLKKRFKVIEVPFSSRNSLANKLQVKLQKPKRFGIEHLTPYEVESLSFFKGFHANSEARQALESSQAVCTFIYLDALLFSNYAAKKKIPSLFHSPGGVHGDFARLDKSTVRLAVTPSIKEYLEKAQKVKVDGVLPMGVPGNWLKEKREEKKESLLFVGRLHPGKGAEESLQIFAELKKGRPGLELYIVGKGLLEEELKRKSEELGLSDVFFEGEKDYLGLKDYYKRASLLLLPSKAEGIATVIMEALSCGLPAVASDLPNLNQFYGQGVVFLPKEDRERWVKEIGKLLESHRQRSVLSTLGRNFAKQYTWDKIGQEFERWLEKVVKA